MNNSKLVILLSCLFAATLTAQSVTAAARGGGFSGGHSFTGRPRMGPGRFGMGMPGRPGMGMPGRFGMGMPGRGMGMPGRAGMGMRGGFNRHDHFDHHHDHFHHHHEDIDFVFIGSFGFPWWWGWGYPYGYYGYGDPYGYGYGYGYGSGYGYGYSSQSRVAELQRRLASAGYYHGSIDGIMGPRTRRAIRAYERDHASAG